MISLVGCGGAGKKVPHHSPKTTTPYKYSIDDHNPLFDLYLKGFPNRTKDIPIVFVDSMIYAGVCYQWSDGYAEIEINKEHWSSSSEPVRQWLIWHELSHCEHSIRHGNNHIDDDSKICNDDGMTRKCDEYVPLSIMRWYLPREEQIPQVCNTPEIDNITKTYCSNLMGGYSE